MSTFTDSEWQSIEAKAAASGMSVEELIDKETTERYGEALIEVPLTNEELEEMREQAKTSGLPVDCYIKNLISEYMERDAQLGA